MAPETTLFILAMEWVIILVISIVLFVKIKLEPKAKRYQRISSIYYRQVRHLYKKECNDIQPEVRRIAIEREVLNPDGTPKGMGTCKELWAIEKELMKEKYGIDWYSIQDVNPDTHYD